MAVDVFGNIIDAFLFPGALNAFCVKTIGLPEAKDQNEQTADLVLQHVVKTVALQRSFMVTDLKNRLQTFGIKLTSGKIERSGIFAASVLKQRLKMHSAFGTECAEIKLAYIVAYRLIRNAINRMYLIGKKKYEISGGGYMRFFIAIHDGSSFNHIDDFHKIVPMRMSVTKCLTQ